MNSLIFFNKDGYPHNFQYNTTEDRWDGKLMFDENGSDTFKTQSFYIFEDVPPIDFVTTADMLKLTYFNYSGITFTKSVPYENEIITNIKKVNDSNKFYSKWIYGTDFDKKFSKGTIITFSGVTGTGTTLTDFTDDLYFTVLDNKKNGLLINTKTDNSLFNFQFYSGIIKKSLNVISVNDYNQNLSSYEFFQNLYKDKKFSVLNSTYNDTLINVTRTGQTYSYINEIKLTGKTNQTFKLRVDFLTERPKLYQGDIVVLNDLHTSINYMWFSKLNSNFEVGKEIILEDINGNKLMSGYTFTIDEIVDREELGEKVLKFNVNYATPYHKQGKATLKDYTIEYDGYIKSFVITDILVLSAVTFSGATIGPSVLHDNREFSVISTSYNTTNGKTTLRVRGYVLPESGNTYKIFKKYQEKQLHSIKITPSGGIANGHSYRFNNAICYTTTTYLDFSQTILQETGITYFHTIDSFIKKHRNTLNKYGIEAYYTEKNNNSYLTIEGDHGYTHPYFYASGLTNNAALISDFSTSTHGSTTRYDIIVDNTLFSERYFKNDINHLSRNATAEILMNLQYNTSRYGFRLTLNSNQYYTEFTGNTQTTINSFINNYGSIFNSNGFYISSGYNFSHSGYTLDIAGINPDVNIWSLEVLVNILSTYSIIKHNENKGIILSGNEIKTINDHYFDVGLATGMIIKITGSTYNENNKEYNIVGLTDKIIQLSYQGGFMNELNANLICSTREFIRKPKLSYNKDIYFKVSWEQPHDPSMFLYDITGKQLELYDGVEVLRYTGPTPLIDTISNNVVFLNSAPNDNIERVNNPKFQQTVFTELYYKLDQLDSSTSYNWIPEPLEIFMGYNDKLEGVNSNTLKIEKIERFENTKIQFNFSGYTSPGFYSNNNFILTGNTLRYLSTYFNFLSYGFEIGQPLTLNFIDQVSTGQTIFENHGIFKIVDISRDRLTFDRTGETFNTTGSTYFFNIIVEPKEILSCPIYGETEIEDLRYKINLNNLGVQLNDDTSIIFKETDIEDNAVDYKILNYKRKEMLSTLHEIYDYIGSYKGLINSIHFFGYNDLELYEYYKNIDKASPLYNKLHKVRIPDIFDNTIEGWNEIDFIAGKYQNQNTWKKTNLFNLTYRITDEEGANILMYSLEEVQYKLTKLKTWLRNNIIPISSNLLDITGVADTTHDLWQEWDESNQTKKSVVTRNSTTVNFNYTATLNFSTNYLITVYFYVLSGETGTTMDFSDIPESFTAKIKTYFLSGSTMIPVQYHKLRKSDLTSFSFNLDKEVDPYIYIETTTYDNGGSGVGFCNNKLFFFDEPRNHWLVNHNFDMTQFKYWLTEKDETITSVITSDLDTPIETNIELINQEFFIYDSDSNLDMIKPSGPSKVQEVVCIVIDAQLTLDKVYRVYAQFDSDIFSSGSCTIVMNDSGIMQGYDSNFFIPIFR